MVRRWTTWVLLLAGFSVLSDVGDTFIEPVEALLVGASAEPLTTEQQTLVDFALERFETQGLQLPDVKFVFRDSSVPCDFNKGRYHRDLQLVEMCSMDKLTMLHELAHAWANHNLTRGQREAFVASKGLDSWNDRDHAWARRGTEHVAETIAWALSDEPHHVMWVEDREDGSKEITYRILTVSVDVEDLLSDFSVITGLDPVFRDPTEWSGLEPSSGFSPEMHRWGG